MRKVILTIIFVLCCLCSSVSAQMIINSYSYSSSPSSGAIGTNTTTYAGNINATVANTCIRASYTPSTAGAVTYCHATIRYATTGTYYNVGIYDASGNLLRDCKQVSGTNANPQQANFTLDSSYTLVSGTTYQLVICGTDTSWDLKSSATTGGTTYLTTGETLGDTMPSTLTGGTSGTSIAVIHCDTNATY